MSQRGSASSAYAKPALRRWLESTLRAISVAGCCLLFVVSAAAQVRYYYDELGRLVEVVALDGSSVQYSYDPAGNITAIRRSGVNTLSLTEFTPNAGPVGTTVTLYGSGFSTTPANNTVLFNGTAATVAAATATVLTVSVPIGATTGKITVSNANGSVQSANNFVVGVAVPAPTIASFTPQVGTVGTVVTVTGTNFQTTVEDNKAAFGGFSATIVQDAGSPTATQLKLNVPNAVPSGKVSVTTPYGKATSAADFYAVPTSVNPADVQFTGRLVLDGPARTGATTAANKAGVFIFDGTQGQIGLVLETTTTTMTGGTITVYQPAGAVVASLGIAPGGQLSLPALPVTGTYTVVITGASAGSLSMRLSKRDLALSGLTAGTVVANPDGSWTIPVSFTVTNNSTLTVQPSWYDMGYLSSDATLDNADQSNTYLAWRTSALSPGASYVVNANFTTSTSTTPGSYSFFVKTDGHNAYTGGSNTDSGNLTEFSETNNVASVSLTLSKPDLVISGLTAGTVVANPNGSWSIPVSYTVTNSATVAAQPWWYDVGYLSSDMTLDNADQSNGNLSYRTTALAPAASYVVNASFTTSTTTAAGSYTVFVKADGNNASTGGTHTDNGRITESSETNNVASVSVALSKPDLAISGLTAGTVVLNTNGSWTIPLSYTVTNSGTMAAQPLWYDIGYLSGDATLDNADQSNGNLSSRSTALAPGASYVVNASFTTSTSTAAGSYTFFVKTDGHNASTGGTPTDNGRLSEASETNNVASLSIMLSKPDLAISGLTSGTIVANPNGSWTIPVSYTVTNNATVSAYPVWYDVGYLSSDTTLDNADQSNGTLSTRNLTLAPGASYVVNASFTTSTATASGAYTFFVKADGHNAFTGGTHTDNGNLSEASETNNVASMGVALTKPDLAISGLTAGTIVANQNGSWSIPVSFTVTNSGTIAAQPSWFDVGYLSSNATLDNADQSNGTLATRTTSLAPGASYVVNASFTTSTSTTAGSYTFFVKADGRNVSTGGTNTDNGNLSEVNETNNVASLNVTLSKPDLAISGLTAGTVIVNSNSWTIPVSFTVTNNGTMTAQPVWYDVGYLSSDATLDNADQSNGTLAFRTTALAPGASYVVNANFTTNTTTAPGSYTLFVKADGHNAGFSGGTNTDNGNLSEASEANNVASVGVTLNKPDLVISGLTAGAVVANPNGSWAIPVSFTVTNSGTVAAQPVWHDVGYLSSDATLDNADQSSGFLSQRITSLAPGASYVVNATFTTTTSTAPGSYTFFVKADGRNAATGGTPTDNGNVSEVSETNNAASLSVTLSKPDLVISGLTASPVVLNTNGSWTIPVSFTVSNNGTAAAQPAWYDIGYLSSNATLDNADQSSAYLAYRSSALAPGASYVVNANFITSTSTLPGSYTFFVKADGHNAFTGGTHTDSGSLSEVSETNNAASVSVTLSRPDLVISGLTGGAIVSNPNGSWTIPVSYTVTNNATVTAHPSWYDVGYLSSDATLDNADQSNGNLSYRTTALAPGTSYVVNNSFTTSTSTTAGSYTFFVKADGHNASTGGTHTDNGNLSEASETNNTAALSITLSRADLVISGFTAGTVVANANGSWTIPASFTVTNSGTVVAPPSWYDVGYLSNDGTLDNADQSNGNLSFRTTALAPGASYVVNGNFTTSTSTAPGNYIFFVKTDGHNASTGGTHTDNGQVNEVSEANNVASVNVTLSGPDLVISGLTAGTVIANPNGSWTIPMSFTVTNGGSVAAPPFWYDIGYLSSNSTLDDADQSNGFLSQRNNPLAPGASYVVNAYFTTSTSTAPGSYTFFVKTDGHNSTYTGGTNTDNGSLIESNEVNNAASVAVTLSRPDLVISALTAGTVITNAGGSFTIPVSFTVTNNGAAAVPPTWYDVGYLSSNATLDGTDQSEGYVWNRSIPLAPGASYVVNGNYTTTTTTTAGSYTLFVKTDGRNAYTGGSNTDNGNITETGETNNIASVNVTLGGSGPDLVISGLTAGPPSAMANDVWWIPVSFTVTNNGTAPAPPAWYDVGYLSSNAILDNADQSSSYLSYQFSALAPGASYVVNGNFFTNAGTPIGSYTFFAKADGHNSTYTGGTNTDNGSFTEGNETNNVASVSITLNKPDLVISGLTAGTVVANGNGSWTIPVTFTVTNNGLQAAQPVWRDVGYLSSNATLDDADQSNSYLSSHGAPLAPGASYVINGYFTTSTTTAPGSYTFFVKADGRSASTGGTNTDSGFLNESNETNNVASVSVTLN